MLEALERLTPFDHYQHWDELSQGEEHGGVSHEAAWAALKIVRRARERRLGPEGDRGFGYGVPESLEGLLHSVDRTGVEAVAGADLADRLEASALLREAVASAALAGATVGLEAGREMLRAGRPPAGTGERMVWNLAGTRRELCRPGPGPLTREFLVELNRRVTVGTVEPPEAAGRLRREGEAAAGVEAEAAGFYEPPPARELPARLDALCRFANDAAAEPFIHPLIRAIALHFWLAYDRPFVDGNGRTARALFHWAMARAGYPLFAYVSLSSPLAAAPRRYARAFLETESDDNDLTYFLLQQAEAVRAGLRAARERLARKQAELEAGAGQGRVFPLLNRRQQAVVAHALRAPHACYGIARHQHSHGVTHQTARDDLFDLVRRDLLTVTRERRVYVFRPADGLQARLHAAPGPRRRPRAAAVEETLPTSLL